MDEGLSVTGRRMVGYAIKWGEPAFVGSGRQAFEERFERGAFARSIADRNVLLCSDHDREAVVAKQCNGTLTLIEDSIGLRVDAWAMDTAYGDDAIHDARCRNRAALSVAFKHPTTRWTETGRGSLRTVTDCVLLEVSIVRTPAYRSAELHAGKMRIEAFEARYAT